MLENAELEVVAQPAPEWESGRAKNVTFIVTQECQLRCRYCYLVGKNDSGRMDFDIARRTVDYLLDHPSLFPERSIVWEFIGGEPFIEIDLIDRVCDYIKEAMFLKQSRWFNSYRFSFSTNGLLYGDERVQRFIVKNKEHLSIAITLDGTRRKHDLQRIYPSGEGSYDDIVKWIPLWLKQFPIRSTKATVGHDDLPYIAESVLHLFDLGIHTVNMNVLFEDAWQDGDDVVFEQQLIELADAMLGKRLYRTNACSFFRESIGTPIDATLNNENWCGAGRMLAVDAHGDFYGCIRFAPHSMTRMQPRVLGNCFDGIDRNRLRPYLALTRTAQSPPECIDCEVANGCAWCQGHNYDASDTGTLFQRATYICKMHKARVRANKYYWDILNKRLQRTGSPVRQ